MNEKHPIKKLVYSLCVSTLCVVEKWINVKKKPIPWIGFQKKRYTVNVVFAVNFYIFFTAIDDADAIVYRCECENARK